MGLCFSQVINALKSPGTNCASQALRVRLGSEMLHVTSRHGKESGFSVAEVDPQERCLLVQLVTRGRSPCPAQTASTGDWIQYVTPPVDNTSDHHRPQANTILSLPAFVLTVDTEQWLDCAGRLDDLRENRFIPQIVVLCQFDSTFKTPVLVETDVAMYIFLRNLVVGYIDRAGSKCFSYLVLVHVATPNRSMHRPT